MEKEVKRLCSTAIKHGEGSELVDSIKTAVPKRTKTDAWIAVVRPTGNSKTKIYHRDGKKKTRTEQVSNALKMIWKEYGIPGRQSPQPFLQAAANASEAAVEAKMQEVYDRMVGG